MNGSRMLLDRCLSCLSVCDVGVLSLLWPHGWMDHAGRPRPCSGHIVLDRNPAPPPQRGTATPIFGPYQLWPNGWMGQDATWYGGKPRPMRHYVRWGPSFPRKKRHCSQFSVHVYCGQTAVCIWIPLDTEVGLSLGNIVLGATQLPLP